MIATAKASGAESRRPWFWLAGLSGYWFATSFKWFLLLVIVLPGQVAAIVPGGEKSSYWGMVLGIGAVWAIVGPAIFGHFSDRAGQRRPFIALGALTTIFALTFLLNAHTIWLLTIAYLLVQVTDDIGTGPYSALLPQLVQRDLRGSASGLLAAAMSAAQIAAVVTAIALGGSGASPYVAMILITIAGSAWTLGAIGSEQAAASKGGAQTSWLAPLRNPDFRLVWLNRFLITLGFYMVVPYAKYYLQDVVRTFSVFGWRIDSVDTATSLLALLIAVSAGIAALVAGTAADRMGRKPVVYTSAALMAGGLLLMLLLKDYSAMCFLALAVGGGYGAYQAAGWALAADVLPSQASLGRDMGIWQMSISSVQILAGSAGFVVTFGNQMRPGFGYDLVFVAAAAAVMLSTLVLRRVDGQVGESTV